MFKKRLTIKIIGRVQGVFFRAFVLGEAQKLNLIGWVSNSTDGSVEVVAEGGEKDLEALLDFCRKGPPSAQVAKVESAWLDPTNEFSQFEIR